MVNIVKIDKDNNYILVHITENNSNEAISNILLEINNRVKELNKDFCIISDLSNYNPTSMEQIALLNKISNSISPKYKVKMVYRVIGDSLDLLKKFARMDKLTKVNNIQYVPTIEHAVAEIQKLNKS